MPCKYLLYLFKLYLIFVYLQTKKISAVYISKSNVIIPKKNHSYFHNPLCLLQAIVITIIVFFCLFSGVMALRHISTKFSGTLRTCLYGGVMYLLCSKGKNDNSSKVPIYCLSLYQCFHFISCSKFWSLEHS